MAIMKVFRFFKDDMRSLPSTYEFKLKVNINIRWLHFLKIGYLVVSAVILFFVYITGEWNYKETGVSSVVTLIRGADMSSEKMVWDAVDYVYPPEEVKAFFITTRAAITKQNQSVCPDNHAKSRCFNDSDCKVKRRTENGIKTGKCDKATGMCLINAWCPVEKINSNHTKVTYMRGAANFTVYVRNHEEYIKFNISRSNDPNSMKLSSDCFYNSVTDPHCPVFKVADILRHMHVEFKNVNKTGGIFQFYIKWHCYFNWNSPPCFPKYSFKRMAKDHTGKYSGYQIRYANYQHKKGKKQRELITVNGLRFIIMIKSVAEQFRFINFLSSVGSYLSYFGIWTFITGVLCAIFLVDKKDLLTLDEASLKKLVRSEDELALKVATHQQIEKEETTNLISNC